MTARDHAGPNPTRLARDNRAEYNRLRLHDQLRRRPARPRKKAEPVERANFSELRDTLLASVKASLTDVAEQRAFDSMVGADSYVGLRASVQRAMLQALCRAPAPIAHARRVVDALAPFERRTQAAIVEAFECHARKGLSLEPLILLLESPLFRSLDESERRHAARLICGPKAGSYSWSGHQALLDQWWLRGLRSMKGALSDDVDSARASWAEFVDQPRIPVYFLQSEAFPGVLLTIIGAPNDPGSLAYARIFFVDEDGQLQVGLKSPVEPVRGGWSEKVDPRGVEYEYRRADLSLEEVLSFIRWIEENHSVSGPQGLHRPALSRRAVYDGLVQFDLRAPRMITMLCAPRGGIEWEKGLMRRGQPIEAGQRAA